MICVILVCPVQNHVCHVCSIVRPTCSVQNPACPVCHACTAQSLVQSFVVGLVCHVCNVQSHACSVCVPACRACPVQSTMSSLVCGSARPAYFGLSPVTIFRNRFTLAISRNHVSRNHVP